MSEIRIVIPAPSPSLNKFAGKHNSERLLSGLRKKWGRYLLAFMPAPKHALAATGKRRLTVERHGSKPLDRDNLYGGLKPVIDELRAFGLLVDDDDAHLELSACNVKLGKGEEPHTVLILQDVEILSVKLA